MYLGREVLWNKGIKKLKPNWILETRISSIKFKTFFFFKILFYNLFLSKAAIIDKDSVNLDGGRVK